MLYTDEQRTPIRVRLSRVWLPVLRESKQFLSISCHVVNVLLVLQASRDMASALYQSSSFPSSSSDGASSSSSSPPNADPDWPSYIYGHPVQVQTSFDSGVNDVVVSVNLSFDAVERAYQDNLTRRRMAMTRDGMHAQCRSGMHLYFFLLAAHLQAPSVPLFCSRQGSDETDQGSSTVL